MIFVFDLELKRPGAPIIQMMHGAHVRACYRFPEHLWLSRWTPGMQVTTVKDTDFDELVRLTIEHNSGA